ncbi:hypothetical protein K438DRAFT_1969221 [Mycena galopus ATCC 62051]|nr:hypothetical protein K438DRAFT_1969221 [Mycena galopus ATCC 62051]
MDSTQIPQDVILEMARFLDLHDAFHLLVTCSSFALLLSFRDFWLKSLVRIQTVHMQPLPCPIGVDIFDLSMDALRDLAIHAYSLRKNWTSECALLASVRTIALDDAYRQIRVIPGTNLVITDNSERLRCWNTQSEACVGEMEVDEDFSLDYDVGKSRLFHLPGRSFIALASNDWNSDDFHINVVEIDYQDQDNVAFSRTYSDTWCIPECTSVSVPHPVVNDKIVGVAFTKKSDQLAMLAYAEFSDGILHHVPLGAPWGGPLVCLLRDREFYIQGQDQRTSKVGQCTVVRVCVDSVHGLDDLDCITLDAPLGVYRNTHLQATSNGVTLVASRADLPSPQAGHYGTNVQFCSISESDTAAQQQHQLNFVGSASYENLNNITHLVAGLSARCAVILDMEPPRRHFHSKSTLGVVQYMPHPVPRTSFHMLDTGDIELDYPSVVLAVDDALGVIYATQAAEPEILYMFSYA